MKTQKPTKTISLVIVNWRLLKRVSLLKLDNVTFALQRYNFFLSEVKKVFIYFASGNNLYFKVPF